MGEGLDRETGMKRAFEFVFKSDVIGDYWEFGVARGDSLARAYRHWRYFSDQRQALPDMRFLAFDTFCGIPAFEAEDHLDGYTVFEPGQYSYSTDEVKKYLAERTVDLDRFRFVQGVYSDSLKKADTLQLVRDSKAAIVHIDCDLYSSARDVLNFIEPHLVEGSLILFDDWFCYRGRRDRGVRGAFEAWLSQSGWTAEEYFRYDWPCICFIMIRYDK